jgi:Putative methyltransferase
MNWREGLRRLGFGVWSNWPEEAYHLERYQKRLAAVQSHLAGCLDVAAARGSVKLLSMCAGDGRDVIGVLRSHELRQNVSACLVELNGKSVALGIGRAREAGLEKSVSFVHGDATTFATYQHIAPADIVLVCGVWGHVRAGDRGQLVSSLASLCRAGGAVVWSRGVSQGMRRLHAIQSLFAESLWETERLSVTSDKRWAVVTARFLGPPSSLPVNGQVFRFRRSSGQYERPRERFWFLPSRLRQRGSATLNH